jgi:hypothetical protein
LFFEIGNFLLRTIAEKCLEFFFYKLVSFFFNLIAAIVSYHVSLVWQVQLLLIPNNCPISLNKDWHAIHWNVFLLSVWKKESVWCINFKSFSELLRFFVKPVFLKDFVRQGCKLKREELFRFSILVLVRFVDFTPDFLDVVLQDLFYSLPVVSAVIKVS